MEFRDVAAKETSGLIARLVAGFSESSRKQIQSLRAALDAALAAAEANLETRPALDADTSGLVERLTKAATAAAQQAAARVGQDAQKIIEALRVEVADYANTIAALSGSLEDAQAHASSLEAELEARRAELLADRAKLAAERKQTEAVRRELSDAHEAQKRADAARVAAETAREAEARARTSADAELRQLNQVLDASRAELSQTNRQLETATAEKRKLEDALGAAQTQARKALERTQEDHKRTVHDLEAKLKASAASADHETKLSVAVLDELLGGFEALAGATSPPDVLTTLTEQLAAEFSRVALFQVKGNRLEGEHQIGFDLPHDIAKLVMPLGVDSLLTRAVGSGQVIRLTGRDLEKNSRAPFTGTPSGAIALPIVVNGETLAVVYADDSGQAAGERSSMALERSARFADALRQHAVALLTRMTTELRSLAELRGYAQSLLDEGQQMYDADVAGGHKGQALLDRLANNIEFARSLFATRVTAEGPEAPGILEEQITAMIESAETPFGQALGAALQRGYEASSAKHSKRGA